MKIGILTLHSNTNFGGGLQQIAMFETLKGLGHEPRFLCVVNDSPVSPIKRLLGIATSYSPRQLCNAIGEAYGRIVSKKESGTPNWAITNKTDDFNYTYLNYTPKFGLVSLPGYVSECDALLFGSDQIWTNVYSDVLPYFGDGMPEFKGKKIAYAACSAHKTAPVYNRRKIGKLLSDFSAIAVRDNTTRQLVKRYSGIEAPIVCDPTLLYDFRSYMRPSPIDGEYIFAYVLGDKTAEWHRRNIERIKAETGIRKVVALTTSLDEKFPWADIVVTDALAVEWMNLLRESRFVYTNSFHAVLFSLKFHRQFIAYYGDMVRSSRMGSLRKQFGLEDRIVKRPERVKINQLIDFTVTDELIRRISDESISFLKINI